MISYYIKTMSVSDINHNNPILEQVRTYYAEKYYILKEQVKCFYCIHRNLNNNYCYRWSDFTVQENSCCFKFQIQACAVC